MEEHVLALGCHISGGCSVSVSSDNVCCLLVALSGCGGGWALWAQPAPCCVLQDTSAPSWRGSKTGTAAHPCCPCLVFI